MGLIYQKCDAEVLDVMVRLINEHHPDLKDARVRIGCLFAVGDGKQPVLNLHGYGAAAIVRKVGLKQRVHGMPDAEIVIDHFIWEQLEDAERDALIDHELHHLEVVQDSRKIVELDSHGRPKLTLRLHDWHLGGFSAIAERYGRHAIEVQEVKRAKDKYGQWMFCFDGASSRKAV